MQSVPDSDSFLDALLAIPQEGSVIIHEDASGTTSTASVLIHKSPQADKRPLSAETSPRPKIRPNPTRPTTPSFFPEDLEQKLEAKRRKAKQKARAVHKRKGSGPSSAMDNIILPALIQEMNQVHSEELKLTINEVIQQFTLLDKESQQSTQNILNGMLSCLEREQHKQNFKYVVTAKEAQNSQNEATRILLNRWRSRTQQLLTSDIET
eukprot:TRINITY_DN13329_c0_g1_i3.p1 TRINITY_DN13329_c0_g1~~TRINITY_DN13329_c0_g1_i3.p1  ORF type:complete len:209 (+),score=41.75 TRINITY_DN13329_c0_g1_i3:73-699(+)